MFGRHLLVGIETVVMWSFSVCGGGKYEMKCDVYVLVDA